MNCKQANTKISIKDVLNSFSLSPSKENSKSAYYFAIDREEKTPSLLVNYVKNFAFDFGTGRKYDNVSIVQCMKQCSVSEALEYLARFSPNFKIETDFSQSSQQILSIKKVSHPALMEYLKTRKIYTQRNFLVEIHYTINHKKYYAIGFKNNSDGWELRNSFYKGGLLKKDISLISNNSKKVCVFEGFMDALSYIELNEILEDDILVLNSIALLNKAKIVLEKYDEINLYLDHDRAGEKATRELIFSFPNAKDCSSFYARFKDLNQFLINFKKNDEYRDVPTDPQN